jgi:hypothetical protein
MLRSCDHPEALVGNHETCDDMFDAWAEAESEGHRCALGPRQSAVVSNVNIEGEVHILVPQCTWSLVLARHCQHSGELGHKQ